jgi:pimeloyl-ACP methyl ester carboxylesterase
MRRLGLIALALLVGACMKVRIDETTVFEPVAFDSKLAQESGQIMQGEVAFRSEGDWSSVWRSHAANYEFPKTPAPYVAARVEHGRSGNADGGLAWTTIKHTAPSDALIVRCGGNASTRQHSGYHYAMSTVPYGDVLMFDYPGYGETGGKASPQRFQAMSGELVPLVREKAAGRRIVLWGHSLGGMVCSELAARLPETSALIIETSARNAREVAQAWTPWYAALFVNIEIAPGFSDVDVANALKGFKGPVLVLGAENDQTLPVHLARSVGKSLKDEGIEATYVEFKGGGHSNLIMHPDFAPTIRAFFAKMTRL